MKKLLIAGAATVAVVIAPPTMALATATSSITGFSFTLIDLDPNDNVIPSLTFSGQGSQTYAYSPSAQDNDYLPGWFTPVQSAVNTPPWVASAAVSTTGASASVSNAGTFTPGQSSTTYAYAYPVQATITITPKTGVIFTTSFSGTATTTIGRIGSATESANAQGYLYLSLNEQNGGQTFSGYRSVYAGYVDNGSTSTGQTSSFSGTVQMTYANLSNSAASGAIYAYAIAQADSMLPVPEPGVWALMLAGVVGVGFFVSRRRSGEQG